MIGVSFALMVLLGEAGGPPPAELVGQLGAKRYAEREGAAKALQGLGRGALPALRAARGHKDPEVRARVAGLLDRIEGALITQPTMISLDFRERPITEVIQEIGRQAEVRLQLIPENLPTWRTTRVTLREPRPVPFWVALERLCEAARLQYNTGTTGFPLGREPVVHLFQGANRPSSPVSYEGPFRISIVSLHYQRNLLFHPGHRFGGQVGGVFPPQPPVPVAPAVARDRANGNGLGVTTQFDVQFQIEGEPRLSLSQRGPVKILEAVDDQGQSLVHPASVAPAVERTMGYQAFSFSPVLHLQTQLVHPQRIGGTIKRLKGELPVTISTRKQDPLVVGLSGASGKTFQNDDATLSIHAVKTNPVTHQTQVELTASSKDSGKPQFEGGGREFLMARMNINPQQIEFFDERGRMIPWQFSGYVAEGAKVTLTLTPPDPSTTPSRLRFYGLTRLSSEVPFEFRDVPMP